MFLPLLIFIAILVVPLIIATILNRLAHIEEKSSQYRVTASYWGNYDGVADAPNMGTIELQDTTINANAPTTNLPSRAVAWHP